MQESFDERSFNSIWYWVILADTFKELSTDTQPYVCLT